MKIRPVIFLVLAITLSLSVVNIQRAGAQSSEVIYILQNGNVEPSASPIQRVGDTYTFTSDIMASAIVVQRDNIVIDGAGYTLQGQGDRGLDLSRRSNVTVKNLRIEGGIFGVYLWNSFGNTITENHITDNMEGIRVQNSSNNLISSNNITRNHRGVVLHLSSNNKLRDNILKNNYNFAVYGTELYHFMQDIDTSNTVNGKKMYYLINEKDLTIKPSTYPDLGHLALVNCTHITVQNLELTHNEQAIILAYTGNSTITKNFLTNNNLGIGVFYSSNNIISENKITNSYRGIQLSEARNNGILTNNITANENGIFLFESTMNNLRGNNITDSQVGVGFRSSSNNYIYQNYFINNTQQVHDLHMDNASITPSLNFWNFGYPRGGNYWSDYSGVDIKSGSDQDQPGSDGIGDTPYVVYGNNKDSYPLMPYGSPLAISILSPENMTYSVNNVPLNFKVSENTSWMGYSLNGEANVTITGNITLSELSEGTHKLTIYAKDTEGNMGVPETVYFTITKDAEPIPTLWIVTTIGIIAIAGIIIIFYLKGSKKTG